MDSHRLITPEEIAHRPLPGTSAPGSVRFSPDGRLITYLYSSAGTLTQELWAYDRDTGREWRLLEPPEAAVEPELSREEQLRRERQRQTAEGVRSYAWSEEGETLLVQVGSEVRARCGMAGEWRALSGEVTDPQLSRDGEHLAFVHEGELYALDLADPDNTPVRLTHDASPTDADGDQVITNGLAEFVAQEEMARPSGFWWSRDGEWLAFEQVDHSPVPLFTISHPGLDTVEVEAHRYPFAGQANVRARLGVVPAAGGTVRWLPLKGLEEGYLARVHWTPDGFLLAQIEARDQQRLEVLRVDPQTAAAEVLWIEEAHPWINIHDDLRFIELPGAPAAQYEILWSSERTGRRELYRYTRDGALLGQISRGDLSIDSVRGVDAAGGFVYVEGWNDIPLERHLFRISLAGGGTERITQAKGTHSCILTKECDAFVDTHSSPDAPPQLSLSLSDGTPIARIQAAAAPDARIAAFELRPPEFIEAHADDGTLLYGALYRPRGLTVGATAPVIVSVYGGPLAQTVTDAWWMTADLRAQYLAQEGFFVLKLDNRGSPRRGLAFEGAIYGHLGDLEVRDQVAGVRSLAAIPEVDLGCVGVYGWSYGGYLALMCLARAPEVFRTAVAGAPVTDWDGYDTHYTERYMGLPRENAEGYRASSVMAHAANIRGRLLILHGMIDENVHFRHTGRLMNFLNREGIPYQTLLFPEERHLPRGEEERVLLERRVAAFLCDSL